jgi:hypothetical protein
MEKVRMPFKVLAEDGELLVEEERDLELAAKEAQWDRRERIRSYKRKCWHKNKAKYEAKAKAKSSSIHGRFLASRKKALSVGQVWELTEEEWQRIWIDAGFVIIPGTTSPSRPEGIRTTAYAARGPNRFSNTYMTRYDLGKPWNKENCYIGFRGDPLIGGTYHATRGNSSV